MSVAPPRLDPGPVDSSSPPHERWVLPQPRADVSGLGWDQRVRHAVRWVGLYPAGWILLGVAAACGIAGWWLRWLELRTAAVVGLLLVVVALVFTVGRPRFGVLLALNRLRVVVGEEAHTRIRVRNLAGRRTFPSRLDLPIGEDVASFAIPSLPAGQEWHQDFSVPTQQRGVVVLGPARSVQGDPFSLAGREFRWTEPVELFVHPLTVNLPGRLTGFVHDLEGQTSNQLTDSDMSFHALREYVPGDDRRHVHWRSSARAGTLMVRQYDQTRQSRVCIALDTWQGSYVSTDEFELAVSAVGSAALQCHREENPMSLMTTGEVLPAVSAMRCLDELTRVHLDTEGGVQQLTRAVQDREPGASVVIWATGSVPGMGKVRRAAQIFDVDTRVVVVMTEPGSRLSVSTLSNVTLIRLSDLDELPRAMRRAME